MTGLLEELGNYELVLTVAILAATGVWLLAVGVADVVARADLLPESLRPTVDFRQHYDVDSSRIRSELGYSELVDEQTALERAVAWERANPPDDMSSDYAAEDEVLAVLTS